MILRKLVELADREGLIEDPNFEYRPVSWIIELDAEGNCLGVQGTKEKREGAKKATPLPMFVPRSFGKRTVGIQPEFLVDNSKYVLGLFTPAKGAKVKRNAECRDSFLALLCESAEATDDAGLQAAGSFLRRIHEDPSKLIQRWVGAGSEDGVEAVSVSGHACSMPPDWLDNDLLTFRVDGKLLWDSPAVRDYWNDLRSRGAGEAILCLVTGLPGQPCEKHLSLKVRGASTSGAALISFNANAFESYGLKRNENAPITVETAEKYGTALRRLLSPDGWPTASGDKLPRANVVLPGDVTVAFWAEEPDENVGMTSFLPCLVSGDPESVKALYGSPWKGRIFAMEDPTPFHTLVLSGAQGRIVLREAITSTVGEVLQSQKQYFEDMDIVANSPNGAEHPSMGSLLFSLKAPGDNADVPAALTAGLYHAAIDARRAFPQPILSAAMNRIRAHAGVSDNRIRLIKAVLKRNHRIHLEKEMDPNNHSAPYLLGRLLAILERIQDSAIGANADVVDRFLGAACGTPALVFPRLLHMHHHHLRKLDGGLPTWYEKMVDDVVEHLPSDLPATLSLTEQGTFMVGYHHQRAELWKKKPAAEANEQAQA